MAGRPTRCMETRDALIDAWSEIFRGFYQLAAKAPPIALEVNQLLELEAGVGSSSGPFGRLREPGVVDQWLFPSGSKNR